MADARNGLTPEEVEVFARGLYWLATQDGIDKKEEQLIREFLKESGSSLRWEELAANRDYSPLEAAEFLSTTYLRRIFLRTAIALVRADGVYSDNERRALGQFADVFEITNAEFGALEQEAASLSLE